MEQTNLKREIGLLGAVMMGLGSIIGTGIFVSIGIAAGVTGPAVILAILLAALVAATNALSSAQLAVTHPVSGGTYEYGYRYLHSALGFTAGWMFLCAKIASAATAALGFAGYFTHLLHVNLPVISIAIYAVILLTFLLLIGIRKTNQANIIIVSITLMTLLAFITVGFTHLTTLGTINLIPMFSDNTTMSDFLYATALMFVAYTGYARIATLGEEVENPSDFIPKAILITLLVSTILYLLVGIVAVGIAGAWNLAATTKTFITPLELVANMMNEPWLEVCIAVGACAAMLGVLLNLILGLSRVVLAMGRRRDLPHLFSYVSKQKNVPATSIIGIAIFIIALILTGSVETTWSFSAFSILIYYSITNLAALQLSKEQRLYHPIVPICGLVACLILAIFVPAKIWTMGISLITFGLMWHLIKSRHWNIRYEKEKEKE